MSECEVDGSAAKSTTATSDKKIQDSPRNEGVAIHRDMRRWLSGLLRRFTVLKSDAREKRGFPSQGHWARLCLARRARPIPLPRNDEKIMRHCEPEERGRGNP